MRCPFCSDLNNKVIDSRINQAGDITRRRRECLHCSGRFTTYERVEAVLPLIIKKDGRREPFDRSKIFTGIQKACQKRPITITQIEKIVSLVESKVAAFTGKELPSRAIGHLVMVSLHQLDKVAYVRFASVYREFKDVEEFVSDLKEGFIEAASDEFFPDQTPLNQSPNEGNDEGSLDLTEGRPR